MREFMIQQRDNSNAWRNWYNIKKMRSNSVFEKDSAPGVIASVLLAETKVHSEIRVIEIKDKSHPKANSKNINIIWYGFHITIKKGW